MTTVTRTAPPRAWPVSAYIERLRTHRAAFVARYHIAELGIFGSYIRNEQRPESDLDVLVAFSETPSLFTLVALEDDLSALLQIKVDLVVKTALRPRIATHILREAVML
ncbi:MAG: nucleotidyltransferase family protein [Chloroflexales bacterium]